MKKILLFVVVFLLFILNFSVYSAKECEYVEWAWIKNNWDNCLKDTDTLVKVSDATIEWWFKDTIIKWNTNLSILLSILAVWSIVFWAITMVTSTWEEEKIKKWKDIVKWWMLWFIAIISAWWLIGIVVNFVYSIWS